MTSHSHTCSHTLVHEHIHTHTTHARTTKQVMSKEVRCAKVSTLRGTEYVSQVYDVIGRWGCVLGVSKTEHFVYSKSTDYKCTALYKSSP